MRELLNYAKASPAAVAALRGMESYVRGCGLSPTLLELMRMRASQINGCAYCIDMHSKDARAAGETEQRLYGLAAWRDTTWFDERERAVLAWTEAVTTLAQAPVPEQLYDDLRRHFSEKEIADLTLAVAVINSWNRLAAPLRWPEPGSYQPRK